MTNLVYKLPNPAGYPNSVALATAGLGQAYPEIDMIHILRNNQTQERFLLIKLVGESTKELEDSLKPKVSGIYGNTKHDPKLEKKVLELKKAIAEKGRKEADGKCICLFNASTYRSQV